MLNELAALRNSLASRGIGAQSWHTWIQPFKKGEAIVAEMNEKGEIARVSTLSSEEVAVLRNIAPDFHNSFPGLNLNCPILKLADASLWNQQEALWTIALDVNSDSQLAYQPKDLNRLRRLLGDFPLKELSPRLRRGESPKTRSTLAILDRLARAKNEPKAFLCNLSLQIVRAATEGRISPDAALQMLYGRPNKNQLCRDAWKATLILDVSDPGRFPYRVADPAVPMGWSRSLLDSEATSHAGTNPFICGLSGLADSRMDEKMPSPNLKILGPTYLMSMNRDIPCQTRYRRTSTEIFPVGKDTVQSLNDALLFITDLGRRNRTWGTVPNGSREQGDLLIAYLEKEPESDLPVAGFFADLETSSEQETATYEARTARIHDALQLRSASGGDSAITIVALSKIDKGRAQVVFSASYSAAAILAGRDRWLSGTQNVPPIAVPFAVAKGKPAAWRHTHKPSPAEMAISFKRQWLRCGQTNQPVPGVDIARIYSILLDPSVGRLASSLLGRYLRLTEPLLIGLSRSLSGGANLSEAARKEALTAIGVYGILLLRQGRLKEIYMNSRDYLLGQFLQMADLLHKLYCKHERTGSIPPQLIGNAAIQMALQSPRRALQVLGNRMPVYLAWADRYEGADAGLVKWSRKELGRLSSALKDESLDTRVTTSGKAELLLGYLASTKQNGQENSTQ